MEEDFKPPEEDLKICQPDEYDLLFRAMGPDRTLHQIVYNKNKHRRGYIHNKKHGEDDSWYAPYLVYEIGRKIGIDVPETEVGLILHKNVDKEYYRDSWFESSIIYDRMPCYDRYNMIPSLNDYMYVSPEVVEAEYLMQNPSVTNKRRKNIFDSENRQSVENYVNSYTWYMINRGSKPREEYSSSEINAIKQELIDRAMFSLRFESYGNFDIRLVNGKNAELEPYYPSRFGMLFLNVRDEKIQELLSESDEKFKESINLNYKPQYNSGRNIKSEDVKDAFASIFETFPEQAEKAYKKLSKFNQKDMESLLANCTRMSKGHKQIALRIFNSRGKDLDEVYEEYLKSQDQIK